MRKGLKLADFGEDETLWTNGSGKPLFRPVEICWRDPVRIDREGNIGLENESDVYAHGYLYALVRNHGNQAEKDKIVYIGITNDLEKRFRNHWKANDIRSKAGETSISVGVITTPGSRPNGTELKKLREELEHILIWVLWKDLWNDRKVFVVPGQGRNGGRAWDIKNTGFPFSGRMPSRIVFPWAAIVPRRNNTAR